MQARKTSGNDAEEFSVRVSIPKAMLATLGAAVLFAPSVLLCLAPVGALLSLSSDESASMVILTILGPLAPGVLGLAGALLFGYSLVFLVVRLILFWRPMLEIGHEGILDRASAVAAGFVPWEEVKDAKMLNTNGQSFVSVALKDEHTFLKRQNPLKRLLMKVNRRYFTRAAINIPSIILPVSPREILLRIRPYLDPSAQRRLDQSLPKQALQGAEAGANSAGTPDRNTLTVVRDLAGALVLFVLSGLWWISSAVFVGTGVLLGAIGLGVIGGHELDTTTLAGGLALIALGVVDFIYFPRLVEKLTGHKPT